MDVEPFCFIGRIVRSSERQYLTQSNTLSIPLAGWPDLAGAPGNKCFHFACRPVGLEFLLEDPVNFAFLVLVFDLPAAFFETLIGVFAAAPTALLVKAHIPGSKRQIA